MFKLPNDVWQLVYIELHRHSLKGCLEWLLLIFEWNDEDNQLQFRYLDGQGAFHWRNPNNLSYIGKDIYRVDILRRTYRSTGCRYIY